MTPCLHMTFFGERTGRPVVFLHGFMGSAASFAPLVDFLPGDYYVLGIDLPGHGKSLFSRLGCLASLESFEDVASMVLDDLDAAGIDRFVLYGYSMGGRLAQQAALTAPERIDGLVLESAGFGISDPDARRVRYENDCRLLDGIRDGSDFDRLLDQWHDMALFNTLSPALKSRLKARKRLNDPLALKRAMALLSVGNQACLLPDLARAPFPIALLYGQADAKYAALAEKAKAHLPRADVHLIPGASHNIHIQYPETTARMLVDFLRRRMNQKTRS